MKEIFLRGWNGFKSYPTLIVPNILAAVAIYVLLFIGGITLFAVAFNDVSYGGYSGYSPVVGMWLYVAAMFVVAVLGNAATMGMMRRIVFSDPNGPKISLAGAASEGIRAFFGKYLRYILIWGLLVGIFGLLLALLFAADIREMLSNIYAYASGSSESIGYMLYGAGYMIGYILLVSIAALFISPVLRMGEASIAISGSRAWPAFTGGFKALKGRFWTALGLCVLVSIASAIGAYILGIIPGIGGLLGSLLSTCAAVVLTLAMYYMYYMGSGYQQPYGYQPPNYNQPPNNNQNYQHQNYNQNYQPQGYQPPPQGYQPPPQGYQPPPQGYQPPPQGYQPPLQGYQPPPQGYQPPPQGYQPPPQGYQPPPHGYQPPPAQSNYESAPQGDRPLPNYVQPSGHDPRTDDYSSPDYSKPGYDKPDYRPPQDDDKPPEA